MTSERDLSEFCMDAKCRSEGFPERDIWSLCVMGQGQMGEFLGRRRRRRRQLVLPGGCRNPDPPTLPI